MFRSRCGGLWSDRSDSYAILRDGQARGLVSEAEAESIRHYIDHGNVVFPRAVDAALVEGYLVLFEQIWKDPPPSVHAGHAGKVLPLTPDLYNQVAKIDGVHHYFSRVGALIFPPPALRFLTEIYDRPPVAFQTMTMRLGSEDLCTPIPARSPSPNRCP
jgi:hypothetical protein